MSAPQLDSPSPLRFALEGDAVRRAAAVIERESTRLATALRRSLPFLARREIPITLAWARALPTGDLLRDLPRPFHLTRLAVEPGGAPGALVLDATALALVLDGVLGGDGRTLPTLNVTGLTSPQMALVSRVVESLTRAMGEVLATRADVRITQVPERNEVEGGDGTPLICAFELGEDGASGRVFLLLPKAALAAPSSTDANPADPSDTRIQRALDGVDIELVVELARVPMKLDRLLSLRVGDTLALDALVGASVNVLSDQRVLFRAKPTTLSGRIAVRIEAGHDR